jgi:hypothetical protein
MMLWVDGSNKVGGSKKLEEIFHFATKYQGLAFFLGKRSYFLLQVLAPSSR